MINKIGCETESYLMTTFQMFIDDDLKPFKRTIQYMLYINVPWMETLNDHNVLSYVLSPKYEEWASSGTCQSSKLHMFC